MMTEKAMELLTSGLEFSLNFLMINSRRPNMTVNKNDRKAVNNLVSATLATLMQSRMAEAHRVTILQWELKNDVILRS